LATARAIVCQNAYLHGHGDHFVDGLIGFTVRIRDFFECPLQNGAAEDGTGQVKAIEVTAVGLLKKELDSSVRHNFQSHPVQR
jgi:hypothetical protein